MADPDIFIGPLEQAAVIIIRHTAITPKAQILHNWFNAYTAIYCNALKAL